jgi:hypothetical protein
MRDGSEFAGNLEWKKPNRRRDIRWDRDVKIGLDRVQVENDTV